MRRNRRIVKRRSSFMRHVSWAVGLLMAVFVAFLVYYVVDSKCTQLTQAIGRDRKLLQQKTKELTRERGNWTAMNTRRSLDAALLRHGLAMRPPMAGQTVRMGADGAPVPGAGAIALARLRGADSSVAKTERRARGQIASARR